MRFRFLDLVLDTDRFLLERTGEPVHVQPQVFDVLAHLLLNRERVVPKTELLDQVWGDRFVSESTLTSRIKTARRVVGDDGIGQSVIKTVHGRGYRWVADVVTETPAGDEVSDTRPGIGDPGGRALEPAAPEQHIHFCRTPDGARLAYATIGHGPPLVRAAHWITHLDYDWHSSVWRHWLEGLSRSHTLVRYDERGCGLSDHDPYEVSLATFVQDLETVVDAMGLERFPLLGLSQGGPVAIEYTRRHPERVTRLVLVSSYVRGRRRVPNHDPGVLELQRDLIRLGWGHDSPSFRLYFSSEFMPDAPPQLWSEFAELLRRTTSAENALRIFDACSDVDVSEAAAQLRVPTLILHGRDEVRIPFEHSRELAALIPGSRLVPLEARNHLLRPEEPAWDQLLREVHAFLAESPEAAGPEAAGPEPASAGLAPA